MLKLLLYEEKLRELLAILVLIVRYRMQILGWLLRLIEAGFEIKYFGEV
jgi:hypothetical protein